MRSAKFFFLFFHALIILPSFAQDQTYYVQLNTKLTLDNYVDFKLLDVYFNDVQVIGVGESTHGTHEFAAMRLSLFQYLVEFHQFNTLFVEADYSNCLGVHEYIQSSLPVSDSIARKMVHDIGIWPWMTEEMLSMVNWMKEYNLNHPATKLSFVGVDVQSFRYTAEKLIKLLNLYGISIDGDTLQSFQSKEARDQVLEEFQLIEKVEFSKADESIYTKLVGQLELITYNLNHPNDYFYRDQKMGENILNYLNDEPMRRGVFWAHNGHVMMDSRKQLFRKKWSGSTGSFLRLQLADKYLAIGQDFNLGSFNANVPARLIDRDIENPRKLFLTVVTVGRPRNNSFAAFYSHLPAPVFIDLKSIPKEVPPKMYSLMNSVGSIYKGEKIGSNYRYQKVSKGSFDTIILINKSTPTKLLFGANFKR